MPRPPVPDLPPDLPPEYADAYRRGFERAFREASGEALPVTAREELARAEGVAEVEVERTMRIEGLGGLLASASAEAPEQGYVDQGYVDQPDLAAVERAPSSRPAWLVPAILGGLVVALLLGAYLAGLVFSSSVDETDLEAEEPNGVVIGDGGSGGTGSDDGNGNDGNGQTSGDDAYQGRVETVPINAAEASCIAPASVDAAGNEVTYEPALSHDGDLTTAWRCPGAGGGETITFQLSRELQVAELGLVPGYAKTDPRSGADRYAENNRLTKVRWTFPNGTTIEQELDGSPDNRDLQTIRFRPVLANEVVLEVLTSTPGSRNTIAVSEIVVGTPAG